MAEEKKEEKKKVEKKPLGLRVNDDLATQFRKYADELGVSQEAAFSAMMKLVDIDKLKERVPGRADDIEEFRTLQEQMLTKYLSSVDAAALALNKATEEVSGRLNNQEETITELRAAKKTLEERITKLEETLDNATAENNRLTIEVGKLNDVIKDKDALIQSLKNNAAAVDAVGAIAELKELVANLKKEPEPVKQVKKSEKI